MITLYDYLDSGNGFKIRLLLAHLNQPYFAKSCCYRLQRRRPLIC